MFLLGSVLLLFSVAGIIYLPKGESMFLLGSFIFLYIVFGIIYLPNRKKLKDDYRDVLNNTKKPLEKAFRCTDKEVDVSNVPITISNGVEEKM